jgi:hypothetical protein
MRTLTLKEFLLEEINKDLREQGRDVQVVFERPKPRLVAERVADVVPLRAVNQTEERKADEAF